MVAATADPSGRSRRKLEDVIVAASMSFEKVAVGCTVLAWPVAPEAGVTAVTVGGGGAEPVVNDHVTAAASAVPSDAFAPVVIRARYAVLNASAAAGRSVTVRSAAS